MEPKALLNMGGNLSRAVETGKRSFSVEMTQKLKDELVQSSVRGRGFDPMSECAGQRHNDEVEGETASGDSESVESGFSTPTGVLAISSTSAVPPPPATPTGFVSYEPSTSRRPGGAGDDGNGADAAYSPATPYYLSQGAKLIQMTCPPKQTGKGLFEREYGEGVTGEGEGGEAVREGTGAGLAISGTTGSQLGGSALGDGNNKALKKRLADARRRTMGWKPRVASPLAR